MPSATPSPGGGLSTAEGRRASFMQTANAAAYMQLVNIFLYQKIYYFNYAHKKSQDPKTASKVYPLQYIPLCRRTLVPSHTPY